MTGSSLVYALLSGLLPALIWIIFWLREDRLNPEPRSLLLSLFLGGIITVVFAIFAERYVQGLVSDQTLLYTLWASIEETFKFIVVGIIALTSKYYDEPIDGMVYCIMVALGFSALENALFILNPLSTGEIAKSIVTGNMRFIGASLVHIVSSSTVGFAIGFTYYKSRLTKIIAAILGLSAAITLHASFNLSIINADAADALKTFGWVWLAVVILIILFEEIKAVKPRTL